MKTGSPKSHRNGTRGQSIWVYGPDHEDGVMAFSESASQGFKTPSPSSRQIASVRVPHRMDTSCIGSMRVDLAVHAQILKLLQPLGVEAALQAIETRRVAQCATGPKEQTDLKARTFQEQVTPVIRCAGPNHFVQASDIVVQLRTKEKLAHVFQQRLAAADC